MQVLESAINWGTEETLGIQKILRPTGIVDGDFIPDIPTRLMERGEYNHVDLILGMTKDEGLLQSVQFELNQVRGGKKSIYCVTVRAQTLIIDTNDELPCQDLYGLAQLLWGRLGPMFLFGRVGEYDSWPEDRPRTDTLTKFYLGDRGRWNINHEHFQNLTDMIR